MTDTDRSLPVTPNDLRDLLSDALAYIAAKDRLLVAHRMGSARIANAAIDKLHRLGDVPSKIEQALEATRLD